ncbi:hypothetical protein AJ87_47905 [Rhizobium yanglingense]|nr:hypothetical protein AJ87_47905 [Rhizobium yanglingense]
MQDAALRLVADPVGIDGLTGIDGGNGAQHLHTAGFALDLRFQCDRQIGGTVLVTRKRKPRP